MVVCMVRLFCVAWQIISNLTTTGVNCILLCVQKSYGDSIQVKDQAVFHSTCSTYGSPPNYFTSLLSTCISVTAVYCAYAKSQVAETMIDAGRRPEQR